VVLLISIDTLRQDHLGSYGYYRNTTPFIDSLAAAGRRYVRAFTPVPSTFPAHASLFTSRYPGWNGVSVHNGGWLPPATTWADSLNRAGILTAGFVSSFVLDRRMTNGFDLTHYDDRMTLTELNRSDLRRRGQETIDACLEWFASAPEGSPLFCFVHMMDVHGTYDVPGSVGSQFVQRYDAEGALPICRIFAPGGIPDIYSLDKLPDFPGRQVGAYYVDRYDGCIAYVDQQIQRLVAGALQTVGPGLACFIVSDHGEAFGEDDYWCTHSHGVLPNQTQVPFIVWSAQPESMAGLVEADKPVSLLDVGPTILDLFEVAPAVGERRHGWSLFDHGKQWATRRLFSLSYTQLLAYNEEIKEGVVIGDQTTSDDFTLNIRHRSSYFNRHIPASTHSVAAGMLFLSLAKNIGSRFKATSAAYYERQSENLIAQRLADLGYIDGPASDADDNFDKYVQPLPILRGDVAWNLPRATAHMVAREFQIRPALDLGCGRNKSPGFLGMDRNPAPGVDVVGDLDAQLPFPDDTFDLVFAGHALAHVTDLNKTMKEIYRVCQHNAQVCIVAPYYAQAINFANPCHKQSFNEHTPRFWTSAPQAPPEAGEFHQPGASVWGLRSRDDDEPGMDVRCLRLEFFYVPQYRGIAVEDQQAARKKYLDVSDQIVYHLTVVKKPMSEVEMQELAQRMDYYDPPYVAIRRLQEQLELREAELARAQVTLAARETDLNQALTTRAARDAALEQAQMTIAAREAELEQMQAAFSARDADLKQTRVAMSAQDLELKQVQAILSARETELEQVQAILLARETELEQVRAASSAHAVELEHVRTLLSTCDTAKDHIKVRGKSLARELDLFRRGRAIRWLTRVSNRSDARADISPAFQQLKDDSLIFTSGLQAYHLQPSQNLQHVPFTFYPLEMKRPNLAGIRLAPIVDMPSTTGVFGIEIVSPLNNIVAQCVLPMDQISDSLPTQFDFSPIRDSDHGRFWLRVFVRDVDAPVRVFEWRKYTVFGLGPLHTRAFCGLTYR
jgi:SAM-dependent methyltransferase